MKLKPFPAWTGPSTFGCGLPRLPRAGRACASDSGQQRAAPAYVPSFPCTCKAKPASGSAARGKATSSDKAPLGVCNEKPLAHHLELKRRAAPDQGSVQKR